MWCRESDPAPNEEDTVNTTAITEIAALIRSTTNCTHDQAMTLAQSAYEIAAETVGVKCEGLSDDCEGTGVPRIDPYMEVMSGDLITMILCDPCHAARVRDI
jgi:hypothetical protein